MSFVNVSGIQIRAQVLVVTVSVMSVTLTHGPRPAQAQTSSTDVAGSGMSQGSGAITTRSDIEVQVESIPGTSRARLGAVGNAITSQLSAIKGCYAAVTAVRPTKVGSIRVKVFIPEKARRATIEVASDEVGDGELSRCIVKALKKGSFSGIRGPAGGMVVIDLTNTAARGAAIVAQERRTAVESTVTQGADGRLQAKGRTPTGEVELVITAVEPTTAAALTAFYRGVQARMGTLLDCRRRASRRGASPEGQAVMSFRVGRNGAATGRSKSTTIGHPNASRCIIRALRQGAAGNRDAAGQYEVSVSFSR